MANSLAGDRLNLPGLDGAAAHEDDLIAPLRLDVRHGDLCASPLRGRTCEVDLYRIGLPTPCECLIVRLFQQGSLYHLPPAD